jgi:hypothetical protein
VADSAECDPDRDVIRAQVASLERVGPQILSGPEGGISGGFTHGTEARTWSALQCKFPAQRHAGSTTTFVAINTSAGMPLVARRAVPMRRSVSPAP